MTQSSHLEPAQRLIVALDVRTVLEAHKLVEILRPVVSTFKIGYWQLFDPGLYPLLREIRMRRCQVFLDAKLNDIPETVRAGVASAARADCHFITVHSDAAMLEAAMDGKGDRNIKVMAVTALTSLSAAASRNQFRAGVMNALAADCDGMIMSPTDLNDAIWEQIVIDDMLIATPGIRLAGKSMHDHGRTGAPSQAIRDGADYIIVGRPIIRADDPRAAAEEFIAELSNRTERNIQKANERNHSTGEAMAAAASEIPAPDHEESPVDLPTDSTSQ